MSAPQLEHRSTSANIKGEAELKKQAAQMMDDPDLEKAPMSLIQERAAEQIEFLKGELAAGKIGPRDLDTQFTALWYMVHFDTISGGQTKTAPHAEQNAARELD